MATCPECGGKEFNGVGAIKKMAGAAGAGAATGVAGIAILGSNPVGWATALIGGGVLMAIGTKLECRKCGHLFRVRGPDALSEGWSKK